MKTIDVFKKEEYQWNIYDGILLLFKIEGKTGNYFVKDNRPKIDNRGDKTFKTIQACFSYITYQLSDDL